MSRIGGVSVAIGVERRLNVDHLQGRSETSQIICAPKTRKLVLARTEIPSRAYSSWKEKWVIKSVKIKKNQMVGT